MKIMKSQWIVDLFKPSEISDSNGIQKHDLGLKMIPIVMAMNGKQLANKTIESKGMITHGYSLDAMDLQACNKTSKFLKPKNNNLYLNEKW